MRATAQHVADAGGHIVAPLAEMVDLGVIIAFAKDPEGYLIEIVQTI